MRKSNTCSKCAKLSAYESLLRRLEHEQQREVKQLRSSQEPTVRKKKRSRNQNGHRGKGASQRRNERKWIKHLVRSAKNQCQVCSIYGRKNVLSDVVCTCGLSIGRPNTTENTPSFVLPGMDDERCSGSTISEKLELGNLYHL